MAIIDLDFHPIQNLPFIRDTPEGRNFWAVQTTGDYDSDVRLGQRYAREAIDFMRHDRDGPGALLGWIMLQHAQGERALLPCDTPGNGITVGFAAVLEWVIQNGRA